MAIALTSAAIERVERPWIGAARIPRCQRSTENRGSIHDFVSLSHSAMRRVSRNEGTSLP